MPFRKSKPKSPFQVNTRPPSKGENTAAFEKVFANMSIRPFGLSAIPEVNSHHEPSSVGVQAPGRVHTSQYTLGNNARSYLECMKPISSSRVGDAVSSAGVTRSASAAGTFASKTGTDLRSLLQCPADVHMASRQTQIDSMAPSDRKSQNSWAQNMIQRAKCCPQKYAWNRTKGGYHCAGGHHYISDDLLAEGNGGVMLLKDPTSLRVSYGPYYPDPNRDGQFLYCGPDPRPKAAPEYINELGSGNSSSGTFKPHPSVAGVTSAGSHAGGSQFGGSQVGRSQSMRSQLVASQLAASLLNGSQYAGSQHRTPLLSAPQQLASQHGASQLGGLGGIGAQFGGPQLGRSRVSHHSGYI